MTGMPFHPDYLVIGHITKDLYNGDYKIGGTVTFSALTAQSLGYRPGIVTSSGPDVDLARLPASLAIVSSPSEATTTFENLYHDGHRRQRIWSQAQVLSELDIPDAWKASSIVHLGPVAQEIADNVADCFPGALLGLTPQGWMRAWDDRGLVHPLVWHPPDALLQRADAVILSEEDVGGDLGRLQAYANKTRLLVVTTGWKGSTVYHQGQVRSFSAPRVRETDPTGAGDIFAAAFLTALHSTRDPWLSAQFANCVAAHSVERSGLNSIPSEREVEYCRNWYHVQA